ncbi:MAG: isoprenylcysteine carboxylmethyltransferase family protein [Betaproteobacteria bacterium]|nr:MAG: isoprenylcysteine carboxylmethyltransferase family protein [Betaproteobacteria bacterium]
MTPIFYDAAMRLPLTAFAAYFLVREWQGLHSAQGTLYIAAHVATMLFLALIAVMTIARRRAVRKADGWAPRLAALAGFLLLYALLLLPRAEPDPAWDSAALGSLLAGHFLCAVALMQLGRSLSILPEARRLVTEGLYARVRHPLYLGEAIATIGVLLLYRIPAAFALVAIQFCLQLWRMREEEKVLAAAFPEYAEYRQRTARLIPGIY